MLGKLAVFVRTTKNMHPGLPILARIGRTYSTWNPKLSKASVISSGVVETGSPLIATLLNSEGSAYVNQDMRSTFSSSER